MAGGRALFS
uniref:Uncharacterized protein n=1 Tax=Arundo donax TaxID=35708 RepID=A0A0A8ZH71_ARUDO